jgi:integrase
LTKTNGDQDAVFKIADKIDYARPKKMLDQRLATARAAVGLSPIEPWVVHDLRRSVATHMAEALGVPPHIIEAVLNHTSGHKGGVAGIVNAGAKLHRLAGAKLHHRA